MYMIKKISRILLLVCGLAILAPEYSYVVTCSDIVKTHVGKVKTQEDGKDLLDKLITIFNITDETARNKTLSTLSGILSKEDLVNTTEGANSILRTFTFITHTGRNYSTLSEYLSKGI